MKKGPKSKPKKDKKAPKAPRPRLISSRELIAQELFRVDDEYRDVGYFVEPGPDLIDLSRVAMSDLNIQQQIYARGEDIFLPSITQPTIPTLFRALPIHNQSGRLVLRGYFTEDDALCFQSMYPSNDEQLILWFFQYLAFKDLNSDFNWMISCLVPKYGNT